jgi:hypothetical protein
MKDFITNVRLREKSHEVLRRRAKARKVSVSSYLRHLIALGLENDQSQPNERNDAKIFINSERSKNSRTISLTPKD